MPETEPNRHFIIHRIILIALAIAIFQDRRWMMSHAGEILKRIQDDTMRGK